MDNVVRIHSALKTPRSPEPSTPIRLAKVFHLTPHNRLFIAGMTALSSAIRPLQELCNSTADLDRKIRYEYILARLLKIMPTTPRNATADATSNICTMSAESVREKAYMQFNRSPNDKALHLRWKRMWSELQDPRERTFAQWCAVALTEALHEHALLERRKRCI